MDGLQWLSVDLKRRPILVRQAWVKGEFVYPKDDESSRTTERVSRI